MKTKSSSLRIYIRISLCIVVANCSFVVTGCGNLSRTVPSDNPPPSDASSPITTVTIGSTPGQVISPTFLGFSHEWGDAQIMMGDSDIGPNNIYRKLLRNLTAFGSGPVSVRIGGNSTDHTGLPNATTTKPFVDLANDLGTPFSLGVNLGADDVELAQTQAALYVSQMPPGSLSAIEIGNEPDGYAQEGFRPPSYNYAEYVSDFEKWRDHIIPVLPSGTKLMGPSWSLTGMLINADNYLGGQATALATFSQHNYVGSAHDNNPSDLLLSEGAATTGPLAVKAAVQDAHSLGVEFRMGEINSLSGGGEAGISDAFGSALWAIDTMFEYASVGVDGVNWHTGIGESYAAFNFGIHSQGAKTSYSLTSVEPLYYGLLFFQEATGHSARLLPTTSPKAANLKTWATIDDAGQVKVVILNKSTSTSGTVNPSSFGVSQARILRLVAPSYQSRDGITFGGQTFDGSTDGSLGGTQASETIGASNGIFAIDMPSASAALVMFTH